MAGMFASWRRRKAPEGIGEERRQRDWLGFHREAGFVLRDSNHRATKLKDADEVVSPTDLWTPCRASPTRHQPI